MAFSRDNKVLVIIFYSIDDDRIITFNNVSDGETQKGIISDNYEGMAWTDMDYRHNKYVMKNRRNSGFATAFTPGGSQYIVFFEDTASIRTIDSNETLSLAWIKACAAWNSVKLIIEGYEEGVKTEVCETTLHVGKLKQITLFWKNINEIKFISDGAAHNDANAGHTSHVIITELKVKVEVDD